MTLTPPQSRLLRRIQRCPKTGYALLSKGEIRMAAALERAALITVKGEIAYPKEVGA